jgi:hypothetical protein
LLAYSNLQNGFAHLNCMLPIRTQHVSSLISNDSKKNFKILNYIPHEIDYWHESTIVSKKLVLNVATLLHCTSRIELHLYVFPFEWIYSIMICLKSMRFMEWVFVHRPIFHHSFLFKMKLSKFWKKRCSSVEVLVCFI